MRKLPIILAFGLVSAAIAQSPAVTPPVKLVTLHVEMEGSTPISPLLYGVNYDWNAIPGTDLDAFAEAMHSFAHVNAVRYPGGWNAEKYNWDNNTEIPWRHFSPIPGAPPERVLGLFQGVTFITPSAAAIEDPAKAGEIAQTSEQLVRKFGDRVKVWEIGNEWFLQRGAKQHPEILQQNLERYASLLNEVVPRMKQADSSIHIYIVAEWNSKEDAARLRHLTNPSVWAEIDGIAIHPYCGMDDDESACTLLQQRIADIRSATGKEDIYSSEWSVVRNHTKDDFGMHNANFTLKAIRDLAMAQVKVGAYWPPAREIPAMSLVSNDLRTPYATGTVFGWMSKDYEGAALRVTGDVDAAAAYNNHTITLFVPSAEQGPEQIRVDLTDLPVHSLGSATVLYSAQPNEIQVSWRAAEVPLPVKIKREADGRQYAEFVLDPGSPDRGTSYEIARVSLR